MNYMMIRTDDMLNGDGLRVVLFCTACDHYCKDCHNPETWESSNGMLFDEKAENEIYKELEKDYISGLTLSGGDPLNKNNLNTILDLCCKIKNKFPNKTIWLYTGSLWEEIYPCIVTDDFNVDRMLRKSIIELCDVVVDGEFDITKADANYKWAGSTNQRVIDVKETLLQNKIILYCE